MRQVVSGVFALLVCSGLVVMAALFMFGSTLGAAEVQRDPEPLTRQQLRQKVRTLTTEQDNQKRKAAIKDLYERYGKKWVEQSKHMHKYAPPPQSGPTTREFIFKKVPGRDLKIFVDYPPNWKASDQRVSIVFWHGGGYTQGNAGQFFYQAQYFTKRGLVVARPEYRIRDLDGSLPLESAEDGISAMRWFKARADRFGIDPELVVAGGGSAGGSMASIVGTVDTERFAKLGFVGEEDDQSISPRPAAMLLYNPFVDFFEPENQRHIWEECVMLGRDPFELTPALKLISAIDYLHKDSPPSIIMFGTRDAFYPQQIHWIVKCRELGLTCHNYVYKGEVHSWYNNSPHIEYTTENADKFLVEIGLLEKEPVVELPHKRISQGRNQIQSDKYSNKKDWDEVPKYRQYIEDHKIRLIPYKHYESRK